MAARSRESPLKLFLSADPFMISGDSARLDLADHP